MAASPKSVTAGLGCGLGCTLAPVCDESAAKAAYAAIMSMLNEHYLLPLFITLLARS